jgi:hypothetical protein
MTEAQALAVLKQAAALAPMPLAEHVKVIEASKVLEAAIKKVAG